MIAFAFVDADGYPTGGGQNASLPDGAVPIPDLSRLAAVRLDPDHGWVDRPQLPEHGAVEENGTLILTWSALPDGTTFSVLDEEAGYIAASGTVEAGLLGMQFDEAGVYVVEISPPRPWQHQTLRVVR